MLRATFIAACPGCGNLTRWRDVRKYVYRYHGPFHPGSGRYYHLYVIPCATCGTCPTFDRLNAEVVA